MFNEERKIKFISEMTGSEAKRRRALDVFRTVENYENRWGADVCTRTVEELQPLVDELGGIHGLQISPKLLILRQYILWCYRGRVDGARVDLLKTHVDATANMRTEMVSGPEHLQKTLNAAFKPENLETADNLFRAAAWLAFAGIPAKDLFDVEITDIDLREGVIRWLGDEMPIYPQAMAAIKNCVELEGFYRITGKQSAWLGRAEGETLIRGQGRRMAVDSFRGRFAKCVRDAYEAGLIDVEPNFTMLWMSGMMYRMYEKEKAGVSVDFTKEAECTVRRSKTDEKKPEDYIKQRIRRIAKSYRTDYDTWKAAFDLTI